MHTAKIDECEMFVTMRLSVVAPLRVAQINAGHVTFVFMILTRCLFVGLQVNWWGRFASLSQLHGSVKNTHMCKRAGRSIMKIQLC